jgi:hypothetical protein
MEEEKKVLYGIEVEDQFKEYIETEKFKCVKSINMPHPFTTSEAHETLASDEFGGILSNECIEEAEKRGIPCGIRDCDLPFKEHKKAIIVKVKSREELKDVVDELQKYLMFIRDKAKSDGFDGFILTRDNPQ